MNIKRVKRLKFRRPDNEIIELDIPPKLDQTMMSRPKIEDYLFFVRDTEKEAPQASVFAIMRGGRNCAGYLIPGQTILYNSTLAELNKQFKDTNLDRFYGVYNILLAMEICARSWRGDYSLAAPGFDKAETIEDIFRLGAYYGVLDKSQVNTKGKELPNDYILSFLLSGFYGCHEQPINPYIASDLLQLGGRIQLKKNKPLPPHLVNIFDHLIPKTSDAMLRFFYVYQAVEVLMAEYLDEKYREVREYLVDNTDISKVELRNKLSKLNDAAKEKARINEVMGKGEDTLITSINEFLKEVADGDVEESFPYKVYQVRNILFHDYARVHNSSHMVGTLANLLANYMLERYVDAS